MLLCEKCAAYLGDTRQFVRVDNSNPEEVSNLQKATLSCDFVLRTALVQSCKGCILRLCLECPLEHDECCGMPVAKVGSNAKLEHKGTELNSIRE